jgi:hypothetical protein
VISLRRSKTDQEAQGRKIGIRYGSDRTACPYRSVRAWLNAFRIDLFRPINRHGRVRPTRLSDKAVALIVKRHAKAPFL